MRLSEEYASSVRVKPKGQKVRETPALSSFLYIGRLVHRINQNLIGHNLLDLFALLRRELIYEGKYESLEAVLLGPLLLPVLFVAS